MRTLELTPAEIKIIQVALQIAYQQNIKIISENRIAIGDDAAKALSERAQKFLDTAAVFDGERDK